MDEFMKFMLLSGAFKNTEKAEPTNNIFQNNFNKSISNNNNFVCPECLSEVGRSEEYCPACGCPIEYIKSNQKYQASNNLICPECFSIVENTKQFCPECGCPIDIILNCQNKETAAFEKSSNNNNYPLKSLFNNYDSIIFLDTETTGLDHKNDRIIELSAIKIINKDCNIAIENKMDSLITLPKNMRISDKITEITGITNSDLIKNGIPSYMAFNRFIKMFEKEKALIVAYNAQFDLCFLFNSLVREGLGNALDGIDFLDALTVFKDRHSYPHKLKDAISAYNLDNKVRNTHRSIDDTLALLEVVKAMDNECKDLDKYINLFGYNPKYSIQGFRISSIKYLPQPYNSYKKLYQ